MRCMVILLLLACSVSLLRAQYVETTILLPDSVSALANVRSLVFHAPTGTIYAGGSDSFLVAIDARTNAKLRRMIVGDGPHLLCSAPVSNKVYCANSDSTVTVIDAVINQPVKTVPVQHVVTDIIYNAAEDKVYCGNAVDSLVRVIDCAGDSIVARVPVSFGPGALCYNPQLNRVYCAQEDRDEVTVIDCSADSVVSTVWVRGVEPQDICYDAATNCVYTANAVSNTVSVIDCAGDTVTRLLPAGRAPRRIIAGPPGKVYCACDGMTVEVISASGVKTVHTGHYPTALSFDRAANKVYCAGIYTGWVTVIDAAEDTVLADVRTGYPLDVCCNPAGNNTYVACHYDDFVEVIGGVSDTVEAVVTFTVCSPGPLCYNTTNNHLYCLDRPHRLLFVIDGESNQVLEALDTRGTQYSTDTLIWNQASNKVYVINSEDGTVSVVDCAIDSIVAAVTVGEYPCALCCSDNGKVYVAVDSGVAVIDGSGDTLRAVVPVPTSYHDNPSSLCYDRADKKLYVGTGYGDTAVVRVVDTRVDSVRTSVTLSAPYDLALCWNQNHDKVYAGGYFRKDVSIIDCTSDTVLKHIGVFTWIDLIYSDSVCDKVYCVDDVGYLCIITAATDTLYYRLGVGAVTALLDNGKRGPANRLYCTDRNADEIAVVSGYKTDSILRRVTVGEDPVALAWNPTYSRIYVSNHGSSSISVIRDTLGPGVEETMNDERGTMNARPTVVRGILNLQPAISNLQSEMVLLSVDGRRVLDLKPGANDVRHLAPGVYFIRSGPSAVSREPSAVTKVVITR